MGILNIHLRKPSDYPSFLLYLLDQTHITVTFSTALSILTTRNAHAVWFALGALNSSLSAKVLKELIQSPRPSPPAPASSLPSRVKPKTTYGMPSTHSTALTFYFAYLTPLIPSISSYLLSHLPPSTPVILRKSLSVLLSPYVLEMGLLFYWIEGLWSRKALGYHTWEQIVAGASYGLFLAAIWRGAWERYPIIGNWIQSTVDTVWSKVIQLVA